MFSSKVITLNKNTPIKMQQHILNSLILEMAATIELDNVKNKLAVKKEID